MGKLAHKRRQCHIGQAQLLGQQVVIFRQQTFQRLQKHLPLGPVMFHRLLRVAFGVLVSIQVMFEHLIVLGNQRQHPRVALEQPVIRIMLRQRPLHDFQAFLDHPATHAENRHRALG